MAKDYKRMLSPDRTRTVDVPLSLVAEKEQEGWKEDTFPDTRPQLHRSTPNKHKGHPALVVASGPSTGMYSLETIQSLVRELGCFVWGTNNVFNVCNGNPLPCNYFVILDDSFWIGHRVKLAEYMRKFPVAIPILHFDPYEQGIRYQRIAIELSRTPDTKPVYEQNVYFHGNSSGITAVQMAMHCGCDPIFLLGHDCGVVNGRTHGNGVRSSGELESGYPQGLQMISGYATLAEHARKLGVRVYNLSPVSKLECFEKLDLGDPLWRRRFKAGK